MPRRPPISAGSKARRISASRHRSDQTDRRSGRGSLPAAIHAAVSAGIVAAGLPEDAVQVPPATDRSYVAALLALCAEAREETAPASRHLLDRVERELAPLGPAARHPAFLAGLGNAIAAMTPDWTDNL